MMEVDSIPEEDSFENEEDEEEEEEESSDYESSSDESDSKDYQELIAGNIENVGEEFVSQAPVKFMRGEINYSQFVSLVSKKHQSGPVLPGFPVAQEPVDLSFETEGEGQYVDEIPQEEEEEEEEASSEDEGGSDEEAMISPQLQRRLKKIKLDENVHAQAYEEELDRARETKKLKQLAKSKLEPALQGMIGEANLRFARGDRHSVIDICLQVVTQAPYAPEPYQTLGMVYEELGAREKSLQFLLIAAHLQRTDVDEWTRLGELALDIDQEEQALTCYGKAYALDRNNIELGVIYASLLGDRMPKKTKLNFYKSLWARKDNRENDSKALLQCSKEMARLHHELGEVDVAASVMINAFLEFMCDVIPEDLNFLLELLIAQKRYEVCVWILTTFYGVGLDVKPEQDVLALTPEDVLLRGADVKFKSLLGAARVISVPDTYPFDVRAKLVVALVNLDVPKLAEAVAFPFTESGPEGVADLFIDIAEAFQGKKLFKEAAKWLEMLISEEEDVTPEVMMNYGECLIQCAEFRKAEEAYKKILEKFPNHVDARLTLSHVLRELGETDEALDFISQDQETGEIDIQLLRQKCLILLEEGRTEDLIPKATLFFSRHFAELQGPDDVHCATLSHKLSRLQRILGTSKYKFSGAGVTKDDEWDLFCRVCSRLHADDKYSELHRLCLSALGSSIFRPRGQSISSISYTNITRSSDVVFYAVQSCWHVQNLEVAFPLVRGMVLANAENPRVVQLLNMFFNQAVPSVRHCRFVLRLLCKLQDQRLPCDAVKLINGNMCMTSGTYKLAIGDYMNVFRRHTEHPFVAFLVGLCFCHLVCQKFTGFKHGFVAQAFTFLQTYRSLRGECQETMYNLGRAYQQLGLTSMALEHYKKALTLPPVLSREVDPKNSAMSDLTAEIAYNVHLIYRHSGNTRLARYYLYKMDFQLQLSGGQGTPVLIDLMLWHKPGAPRKDFQFFCLVCNLSLKTRDDAEKHHVQRSHQALMKQPFTQEELRKFMQARDALISEVTTVSRLDSAADAPVHQPSPVGRVKRKRRISQAACDDPDPRYFEAEPSQIEADLNLRGDLALIGLEYLVEVKVDGQPEDGFFFCGLCAFSASKKVLTSHLVGGGHRANYVRECLPSLWSYHERKKVVLDREALDMVARKVEEHFVRSRVWTVTKENFLKSKKAIVEALDKRSHAKEVCTLVDAIKPALKATNDNAVYFEAYNFFDVTRNDVPTAVPKSEREFESELVRKLDEHARQWAKYDQDTFEDHPEYPAEWKKFYAERFGGTGRADVEEAPYEWRTFWIDTRVPELQRAGRAKIRQQLLAELTQHHRAGSQ